MNNKTIKKKNKNSTYDKKKRMNIEFLNWLKPP
jgi:hypothetical protein